MDKRLTYLLIAVMVLISFGLTIFIYLQQTSPSSTTQETPEVYFAGGLNAKISIQDQQLTAGQRTTVPIYISTDADVATVQVVFEYDPSVLEIDDSLTDESDQFDTPYEITIDDVANKVTITANNQSSSVNTNGTDILLANLRITPNLSSGQESTTESLQFKYNSDDTDESYATLLTTVDNVLEEPSDPTFTITGGSSSDSTTLSVEEKELVTNEESTVDITLSTSETIIATELLLNYDPTYLEISSTYIESTDMTSYSLFQVDETNGLITIQTENSSGIDGTNGEITIITLNVTPLSTTTATNLTFDYTAGGTTDTNISTAIETDILSSVNNATFEIVDEATTYACFANCDSNSQCPGGECSLSNGQYICINLDCTDETECECPESEYLSRSATTTSNLTSTNSAPTATVAPTPRPTTAPVNTPVIADLPEAGTTHMTFAVLALGLSALILGLLIKKDFRQ